MFLPFLNGERTPDLPHARGTLSGVSATNFTPHHLIRAAVEGVSFGILNGLDRILAGKPVEQIQVIGGGARSRAWRQLLADATAPRSFCLASRSPAVSAPPSRRAWCGRQRSSTP